MRHIINKRNSDIRSKRLANVLSLLLVFIVVFVSIVGCKETDAKDGNQMLDDDMILNPIDKEKGFSTLEYYMNLAGNSEEDKENLEYIKSVYDQYHYCICVSIKCTQNSDGSVAYDYFFFGSDVELMKSFGNSNARVANEIENRIIYLWLNEKVDKLYSYQEYGDAIKKICEKLNSTNDLDQFNSFVETDDLLWIKTVSQVSDSADTVPKDEKSINNPYIADVLLENYYLYNSKLSEHTDLFFEEKVLKPELAKVYKEYGDCIFGKSIGGKFEIENYSELYGELDKKVIEELDLTQEDFR